MNLSTLRGALFSTCTLLCGQWHACRVFFFFLVTANNPDRLIQQLFLFTHGQHFFFPRKRKSASTCPNINLIYFPSVISPVWVTLQWRVWTRRWCQPPRDGDIGENRSWIIYCRCFQPTSAFSPLSLLLVDVAVTSYRSHKGFPQKNIIVCTDNVSRLLQFFP